MNRPNASDLSDKGKIETKNRRNNFLPKYLFPFWPFSKNKHGTGVVAVHQVSLQKPIEFCFHTWLTLGCYNVGWPYTTLPIYSHICASLCIVRCYHYFLRKNKEHLSQMLRHIFRLANSTPVTKEYLIPCISNILYNIYKYIIYIK